MPRRSVTQLGLVERKSLHIEWRRLEHGVGLQVPAEPRDLVPARRAIESGEPAVVHVVTNKEANTWPPGLIEFARVYTGEQAAE